jgi:adenosine deaminase
MTSQGAPFDLTALPKVDLHLHQEQSPRLDRVLAARAGHAPYDWRAWAKRLVAQTPPGMPRLAALSSVFPAPVALDADPETFIARLEDLMTEAAADGAVLVEVRCGNDTVLRPGFIELLREAERRTQVRYPEFHALAVVTLVLWLEPALLDRVVAATLAGAREGIAGIDLLYRPYDREADWSAAYGIAARATDTGLGVTAHAGEFSSANIEAALRTPGLTRLGHAVHAADSAALLELVRERGVTIECCLSCNVLLGAVASLEVHPIRTFVEHGIPVALGTDNPVQLSTTIAGEYAAAASLGFGPADLLAFTRDAIASSFSPKALRASLLSTISASGT